MSFDSHTHVCAHAVFKVSDTKLGKLFIQFTWTKAGRCEGSVGQTGGPETTRWRQAEREEPGGAPVGGDANVQVGSAGGSRFMSRNDQSVGFSNGTMRR